MGDFELSVLSSIKKSRIGGLKLMSSEKRFETERDLLHVKKNKKVDMQTVSRTKLDKHIDYDGGWSNPRWF